REAGDIRLPHADEVDSFRVDEDFGSPLQALDFLDDGLAADDVAEQQDLVQGVHIRCDAVEFLFEQADRRRELHDAVDDRVIEWREAEPVRTYYDFARLLFEPHVGVAAERRVEQGGRVDDRLVVGVEDGAFIDDSPLIRLQNGNGVGALEIERTTTGRGGTERWTHRAFYMHPAHLIGA